MPGIDGSGFRQREPFQRPVDNFLEKLEENLVFGGIFVLASAIGRAR
jgi:hypothetical protein